MPFIQADNQILRAALARMDFLSCGERLQLLKKLDNISALAVLSKEDLEKQFSRPLKIKGWASAVCIARAERDVLLMKQYAMSLILFGDEDYPPLLREIAQPPFALYVRGDVSCLKAACVAVVGTRQADGAGLKAAFDFSAACAEAGITVVSGLAAGIDGAAHKGALSKGKTAAVEGCGIDRIYPALHKKLAEAILRNGGCILSEYPPETEPRAWQFPERNRIISGLSQGVMTIEAPAKSGALITVDFALEQNRDVWFHPVAVPYAERNEKELKRIGSDPFTGPAGVFRYMAEGAPVTDDYQSVIQEVLDARKNENSLF